MKKHLLSLLLCSFGVQSLLGTPVLFNTQNLISGTNICTILVTPDAPPQSPLVIVSNLVSVNPFTLQFTNSVTVNMAAWGYTIRLQSWPRGHHIIVPLDTNTWDVTALFSTNEFVPSQPFYFVPQILIAGANVTLTPGTGTLTISANSAGGTPALAGTNVFIELQGGSNQFNVPFGIFDLFGTGAALQARAVTNTESGVALSGTFTGPLIGNATTATTAAVVTGSQSNVISAAVTNGPVWLAYGTFTNQYLVTGFTNGLSFYNGTNVFDGQLSAGTVLVYTNFTAPAGMTNFLVFNDPNWVNQWGNVWGITTNYPDVNQMVIAISLGSPYGFNGLLGPNNWAIYPFGPVSPNPFMQVFAPGNTLSPILDVAPVSVEASFGTISNLAATSLTVSNGTGAAVAPSLVVTVNRSNSVTMTQDTAGPDARIILNYSTTPSVPGVLTLGNISENVNGVTFAGLEAKTYATNSGGYWLFITKANTDWATRLGGMPGQTIYQKFVMNDLGQFFAGPSELYFGGYNEDDTNHSVGPAFVNAFGMTYPTTNSAPLWIMPSKLPTNAIAGDIGFDGSNLLLVSTNLNGKIATNAVVTSDGLTNGSAAFAGTGAGLTSLTLANITGIGNLAGENAAAAAVNTATNLAGTLSPTNMPTAVTYGAAIPATIPFLPGDANYFQWHTNANCTVSAFVPVASGFSSFTGQLTNSSGLTIQITLTAFYSPVGAATTNIITLLAGQSKLIYGCSFGSGTNLCDVP